MKLISCTEFFLALVLRGMMREVGIGNAHDDITLIREFPPLMVLIFFAGHPSRVGRCPLEGMGMIPAEDVFTGFPWFACHLPHKNPHAFFSPGAFSGPCMHALSHPRSGKSRYVWLSISKQLRVKFDQTTISSNLRRFDKAHFTINYKTVGTQLDKTRNRSLFFPQEI